MSDALTPRITIVINSIGMGGAEQALLRLLDAGNSRPRRYRIQLFILDTEPDARALPHGIDIYRLDARGSLLRAAWRLRCALRSHRPDLVVSLLVRANLATALVAPMVGVPAILCERMHLGSHLRGRYRGLGLRLRRWLPRLLYRRATRILAVSTGVADNLVADFGVEAAKLAAIPNGFDGLALAREAAQPPPAGLPDRYMVAVGRLVEAKGFHDVIRAYARVEAALPLIILGEGPQRMKLERLIEHYGLQRRILLPGFLPNPLAVVGRAAFLVSGSRNEGFPNAIGEAMALGIPVLATDCPSGPSELLGAPAGQPGVVMEAAYGLIVPMGDVAALTAGMQRLHDPAERARWSKAARDGIARYDAATMFGRYWAEFDAVLASATAAGARAR